MGEKKYKGIICIHIPPALAKKIRGYVIGAGASGQQGKAEIYLNGTRMFKGIKVGEFNFEGGTKTEFEIDLPRPRVCLTVSVWDVSENPQGFTSEAQICVERLMGAGMGMARGIARPVSEIKE